jgi:hypothetical protein
MNHILHCAQHINDDVVGKGYAYKTEAVKSEKLTLKDSGPRVSYNTK